MQDLEDYRGELTAHCYRMLGSVHEAEDLVQETMVRAWRNRERYDERRASVRTWLYKIATNACLTALEGRARRPLPTGLVGVAHDPETPLVPAWDIPWLEPIPDAVADPAAATVRRGTLRLALVAALQLLPPKQRAVLVLREVLEFSAAEVAGLLDTTTASVNSALQRARATLAGTPVTDEAAEPDDAKVREQVDRYARAFAAADVEALVALLTEDVILEMPPVPLWFRGRPDYAGFMRWVYRRRGTEWRVVPTAANGQPSLVAYVRGEDGEYRVHTLHVLTVTPHGIAHNTVFADPAVFRVFGLAEVLP